MSASLPGNRELPESQYDLNTYWGRVRHTASITDPRTLLAGKNGLEDAKRLVMAYKSGEIKEMTPALWKAKKIVDSTIHPGTTSNIPACALWFDTGEPVLLPFRMSCFALSNLVVTAGMLTPGLSNTGTVLWQIMNQSLNVAINHANANKSTPLSYSKLAESYLLAVGASAWSPSTKLVLGRLVPFAAVASAGFLNVFLMRGEEMRVGIDVYPVLSVVDKERLAAEGKAESDVPSLGKSRKAATLAVGETALSRVLNSSPIMVVPPLILVRLQRTEWLRRNPRLTLPVNLGLILGMSFVALPLALAAFPQRQRISADNLEEEFRVAVERTAWSYLIVESDTLR
ncbi:sideroflexin-5 [Xylaria nigripes]|nr:sideroflexin-5 [Xylaria nigripes]